VTIPCDAEFVITPPASYNAQPISVGTILENYALRALHSGRDCVQGQEHLGHIGEVSNFGAPGPNIY
jgi:hypothetical protein